MRKPFGVNLIRPEFVFSKGLVACIVYLLFHVSKRRVYALKIRMQLPPHWHCLKDKHFSLGWDFTAAVIL